MTAKPVAVGPIRSGVLLALASAVAFGLSTPFVQLFGRGVGPFATAGLLYAGAATLAVLTGGAPLIPASETALGSIKSATAGSNVNNLRSRTSCLVLAPDLMFAFTVP